MLSNRLKFELQQFYYYANLFVSKLINRKKINTKEINENTCKKEAGHLNITKTKHIDLKA